MYSKNGPPPSFIYRMPRQIPQGTWHDLLRSLVFHEEWFGLVWRDGHDPSVRARELGSRLTPLKIDRRRSDRWPGTRLSDSLATVIRYRASAEALPILTTTASPFEWVYPDLPEDLFFGSDESGLAFISVAHERDAWLLKRRHARAIGQQLTLEKEELLPWEVGIFLGNEGGS